MSGGQKRGFWRDPLFHFLILGALIFAVNRFINAGEATQTGQTIYIGAGDVERLASVFEERWGRPPTADERAVLVDDFVREEILYREALAMGLDKGDTIVRRRLAQKLAFLSQDNETTEGPSEAELRAWFDTHRELYVVSPRYTFVQVFFQTEPAAKGGLEELSTAPNPAAASGHGDESPIPSQFTEATRGELNDVFGTQFADRMAAVQPGAWSGPIASDHGYHLIFLRQRIDGYEPQFADVRSVVESDWLAEQSKNVDPAFYDEVRAKYDVEFDASIR